MLFLNLKMGKKRKTRQEKIILQLKRELAKTRQTLGSTSTKFEPRQEAISKSPQPGPQKTASKKRPDLSIFFYDPRLIKKDLLKTLVLSFIVLSLEFVLYLRLR